MASYSRNSRLFAFVRLSIWKGQFLSTKAWRNQEASRASGVGTGNSIMRVLFRKSIKILHASLFAKLVYRGGSFRSSVLFKKATE